MKTQLTLLNSNLAEIKVSYTLKVKFSEMQKVINSKDAEAIFRAIWSDTMELREEFYILLLNRANRVLAITMYPKAEQQPPLLTQNLFSQSL